MNNFTTVLSQVIQWFGQITIETINWLESFEIEIGLVTFSLWDLILTIMIISICITIFITTPQKSRELENASKFWKNRMDESNAVHEKDEW